MICALTMFTPNQILIKFQPHSLTASCVVYFQLFDFKKKVGASQLFHLNKEMKEYRAKMMLR